MRPASGCRLENDGLVQRRKIGFSRSPPSAIESLSRGLLLIAHALTNAMIRKQSADETTHTSFVLRPSSIEGVGVHATHDIAVNVQLDLWGDEKENCCSLSEIDVDSAELIRRYGVVVDGAVWFPPRFNRMAIGWYLNHSDSPNVEWRMDDQMYSLRPISAGEELTIDYRLLEPTTAWNFREGPGPR
jgi:hypothetical protein